MIDTAIPPNIVALYFKLRALIAARKWSLAFAVADSLDLEWKNASCR